MNRTLLSSRLFSKAVRSTIFSWAAYETWKLLNLESESFSNIVSSLFATGKYPEESSLAAEVGKASHLDHLNKENASEDSICIETVKANRKNVALQLWTRIGLVQIFRKLVPNKVLWLAVILEFVIYGYLLDKVCNKNGFFRDDYFDAILKICEKTVSMIKPLTCHVFRCFLFRIIEWQTLAFLKLEQLVELKLVIEASLLLAKSETEKRSFKISCGTQTNYTDMGLLKTVRFNDKLEVKEFETFEHEDELSRGIGIEQLNNEVEPEVFRDDDSSDEEYDDQSDDDKDYVTTDQLRNIPRFRVDEYDHPRYNPLEKTISSATPQIEEESCFEALDINEEKFIRSSILQDLHLHDLDPSTGFNFGDIDIDEESNVWRSDML